MRFVFTKPVNRANTFIADDWHTRGQARRDGKREKVMCPRIVAPG